MKHISLLFAGDVMVHDNQLKSAYDSVAKKYDFTEYFRSIEHYIRNVDVAVCNLETTISGGAPTGFPKFNTPEEIADTIAQAGFHCVAAANNHSFDTGIEGIKNTREVLEKRSLTVIGTRKSPLEKAYAVFSIKGAKVAILNYTYETARINGKHTLNNRIIGDTTAALINSFCFETIETDLERVAQEISLARNDGAEVIIVYYHWGNEYERYSNVFQQYVAWRTAHMGADAIIGSHAHVMQELSEIKVCSAEKEKCVPVFYGLGNYIWGAPPIRDRDTVLNNVLALLDVQYDEVSRDCRVVPSYVPMYIAQKNNQFYTIALQNVPQEEYNSFKTNFNTSVETILEQILESVENQVHPAPRKLYFDNIFRMYVGERRSLLENFLPLQKYVRFHSEDAIIASVLQNGYIVGNSAGYVGITAVDEDGVETLCMVQVMPGVDSTFPILVNAQNSIRDIYQPPKRLIGEKSGLPANVSLCENPANAWKAMYAAAFSEGIFLKIVSGYRTKKTQQLRKNKYAEVYGEAAASRRYQQPGRSEHHLALALDVNAGENDGIVTPKAVAIRWIQKNCSKFGFVARKLTASIEKTAYVHLRYVNDQDLAEYLSENNVTLEAYLTDYEHHQGQFQEFTRWKRTFITEDDDTYTLSIYKICHDILGISVPKKFLDIQHRVVPQVLLSDSVSVQKGSVFFYDKMLSNELQKCRNALRSGSVVAFASQQILDERGNPMPTIIVEDPLEACVKVGKYVRDHKPAKSICVTGSAGKSTTAELIYHLLASKFNTHMSKLNNANNRIHILQLIQDLEPEHEMYVQEVGGSFPQHIEKAAQMLQPDVAIITNIEEAHLDLYKTFDNIKRDKLSLLENRRPGGLGLLNIDNAWLNERVNTSSDGILTYSIDNTSADYFAQNIQQSMDGFSLVIVEKATGLKTPITLNIIGQHNVYNILAAFAVGRWAGMTAEEISAGLSGVRQAP